MKNLRTIILSAMVAGVLIVPGTSATADAKDEKDHYHFRKHDHHGKWKGITASGTVTTSDMIRITGVMFVMITVAIIIRRRFDRISKIFAMREMKSNKVARSCAGITRS